MDKDQLSTIQQKYQVLRKILNERQRRLWAATEANTLGHGGVAAVAKATGLSRTTIHSGAKEIHADASSADIAGISARRKGGGRKKDHSRKAQIYGPPEILDALEGLMQPTTTEAAESPLRWTCMSVRSLVREIAGKGYRLGTRTVVDLLALMQYHIRGSAQISLKQQSNLNDRFAKLNLKTKTFLEDGQSVIFVEVRKKNAKHNFKNVGEDEYHHTEPEIDHADIVESKSLKEGFTETDAGLPGNHSWIDVEINDETADAAANCIHSWWTQMGRLTSRKSKKLLILADIAGSKKIVPKQWRICLKELANFTALTIHVCRLPPGIFRFVAVQHRLLTASDWQSAPLNSYQTITTMIGRAIKSDEMETEGNLAQEVQAARFIMSTSELAKIKPEFEDYWNYSVSPD